MADKQQHQIADRKVINTIEDTSKYQTGDARRLRVMADPLRIPVAEQQSSANQLAQALSSIKPQLMDYAVDKQAEAYGKDITTGGHLAQTGGVASGEMQQYGYDKVKAVNDWTDWQVKVTQDYEQNFDKENGNVEDFLKTHWESNPFKDKSTTYTDNFSALASKTMAKVREAQGIFKADKQTEQNNVELTRMFSHDIKDVMGAGKDYTTATYEIRRENLKQQFPGKTNSQLDELAYQAALQSAQDSGDTKLLNIFKSPHSDGTPGLYEIPKWKEKIDNEVRAIIATKNTNRTTLDVHNSKLLKDAADVKERAIGFDLIRANGLDDPTERDKAIAVIVARTEADSKAGIPISDTMIKTLMTASSGIDKKQETAYQNQNYNTLRLGNPSTKQIAHAVNSGDISQAGFEKLMNAQDAEANRATARSNKAEKPLISNAYIKQMNKDIDANAGYSWGSMAPANEQAKKNSEAVKSRIIDHVEELVDSGVSPKDAARQGSELGVKMLNEAGMASKALKDANSKLDKVELKHKDPVAHYTANPADFIIDSKSNTVPKMDAKALLIIQRKALAVAKSKQLKNHESTH